MQNTATLLTCSLKQREKTVEFDHGNAEGN